jgi:hypothetical protein
MTWDLFAEKLAGMGGIVEEFLEAKVKRSPSVQFRVDPLGELGKHRIMWAEAAIWRPRHNC